MDELNETKKRRPRARANGEGSIYQRSSDGLWVGMVSLADGKRRPVYGRTRRAVREKFDDLQRQVEEGAPVTPGRGCTLGQYLQNHWLTVTCRSG